MTTTEGASPAPNDQLAELARHADAIIAAQRGLNDEFDRRLNLQRIERELRALLQRHHDAQVRQRGGDLPAWCGYQVATAELANILEPGSAPMLPRDIGHAATCGTCMPDGDGVSKWSDR